MFRRSPPTIAGPITGRCPDSTAIPRGVRVELQLADGSSVERLLVLQ